MTTFKQFITEPLSLAQFAKQIKTDCATWLSQFGDVKLYRGINLPDPMVREITVSGLTNNDERVYIGAVRNNRKPRDITSTATSILDNFFKSEVGVPLRSASLFTVKRYNIAESYGSAVVILPIGEYHYAWSPYLPDPYSLLVGRSASNELKLLLKTVLPQVTKKYKHISVIGDILFDNVAAAYALTLIPGIWRYDTGLRECHQNNEIMLVCDKYYALSIDAYNKLIDVINENP